MSLQDLLGRIGELNNMDESWISYRHTGQSIEDVSNEMDFIRQYRRLDDTADPRLQSNGWMKPMQSKAVQTEPDFSGLSPTWILAWQSLIDEVYTGLGNSINSFYHPPSRKDDCKKMKSQGTSSQNMQYFTYENGYWKSKLMPDIKLPALDDEDRQLQIFHSEKFKKNLKMLMAVATKLRDLVSCLDANTVRGESSANNHVILEGKLQQTDIENSIVESVDGYRNNHPSDKTVESCTVADKCQQTDFESTIPYRGQFENVLSVPCSGVSEKLPDVDSLPSTDAESPDLADVTKYKNIYKISEWAAGGYKQVHKMKHVQTKAETVEVQQVKVSTCLSDVQEKVNFLEGRTKSGSSGNGVLTLRTYSEQQKLTIGTKMNNEISKNYVNAGDVPNSFTHVTQSAINNKNNLSSGQSCSKSVIDSNIGAPQKENLCHGYEKHSKQSKAGTSGSVYKNFIKKNILASKLGPHRTNANNESSSGSTFKNNGPRKGKVTRL